jgi:hypothetical protein
MVRFGIRRLRPMLPCLQRDDVIEHPLGLVPSSLLVLGIILDEALDHIGERLLVGGYIGLPRVDTFCRLGAVVGGQQPKCRGNVAQCMLKPLGDFWKGLFWKGQWGFLERPPACVREATTASPSGIVRKNGGGKVCTVLRSCTFVQGSNRAELGRPLARWWSRTPSTDQNSIPAVSSMMYPYLRVRLVPTD